MSKQQSTKPEELKGSKADLEIHPPDNRVRLTFPGKPDAATKVGPMALRFFVPHATLGNNRKQAFKCERQ